MQLAMFVVLVLVIACVAIDAIGRLDERRNKREQEAKRVQGDNDPGISTTQKIIVDLTGRS